METIRFVPPFTSAFGRCPSGDVNRPRTHAAGESMVRATFRDRPLVPPCAAAGTRTLVITTSRGEELEIVSPVLSIHHYGIRLHRAGERTEGSEHRSASVAQ